MQNRHLRERLGAAGNRDVRMPQRNLVGGVGDGLIGRGAGARHGVGLQRFRKVRQQRHFARDIRRDDRLHDRAEHQQVDRRAVERGPLHQFSDGQLAEVDGRVVPEDRS